MLISQVPGVLCAQKSWASSKTMVGLSGAYRRYCMQESDWVKAVLFLDEFDRAGWRMIEELLKGTTSAKQLLIENPFCSFQS